MTPIPDHAGARSPGMTLRLTAGIALAAAFLGGACSGRPPPAGYSDATIGEASWYGIEERGRPTANGEPMDPEGMTAAHRTLPFHTVVRVTDLATGRAVEVRINDRGPFIRGRIIDLSHRAARELGIAEKGVARVMLTQVSLGEPPSYAVQVGSYGRRASAEEQAAKLRAAGWRSASVRRHGSVHRVRVGRYSERREADRVARRLRALGYEVLVVQLDP